MRWSFSGLWRHSDFMKLWVGQAISAAGSTITGVAFPLVAAITLDVTPEQMGVLTALGWLPYLVVGLFAGAWADRVRRRPILIVCDIGRALMVALIPVSAALGFLRIEFLYAVTFVTGSLSVFFDMAWLAYLPVLVSREHIVEANGKMETSYSIMGIVMPGVAGWLVDRAGGPLAMGLDALSFAVSAISLSLIRTPEAPPQPTQQKSNLLADIPEGFRVVFGNPVLRWLTIGTALFNLFGSMLDAVRVLYIVRELELTPVLIGLVITFGGPGTLLGAVLAQRITKRLGLGPTISISLLIGAMARSLLLLAAPPMPVIMTFLILESLIFGFVVIVLNINVVSLRQSITPDRLLGRVNATARFIVFGIFPIGAVLGGLLGGAVGLRPTLTVAVAGIVLAGGLLFVSPVVRIKEVSDAQQQKLPTDAVDGEITEAAEQG